MWHLDQLERRQLLTASLPNAGATSFAEDGFGTLHAAYYDTVNGDLNYATFDGVDWSIEAVDTKGNVGLNPSLAFNSEGNPLISYFAQTGKDLKLAKFDGENWKIIKVDSAGNVGRYSSIAVDPDDDTWSIAYESATGRNLKLARQKGKGIVRSVIEHFPKTSNFTVKPSLAFDLDGNAAVAYTNPSTGEVVLTTPPDHGKKWDKANVDGLVGVDCTLTFNPDTGSPQLLYTLDGNQNVFEQTDDGWTSTPVEEDVDDVQDETELPDSQQNQFAPEDDQSPPVQDNPSNGNNQPPVNDNPPANDPPSENPPADNPPSENPPAENPPADNPPSEDPPTENPPAEQPPVEDPPAENPPAESPPSENPPAENPPAEDPPAENPPSDPPPVVSTMTGSAPGNVAAPISWDDPSWISLTWTDNTEGEVGFRIERAVGNSIFSEIDIVPAGTTWYDDATTVPEHSYSYRVTPFDGAGDGPVSDAATVLSLPAVPNDVHAVAVSPTSIDVTWTNLSQSAQSLTLMGYYEEADFTTHFVPLASGLDPSTSFFSVTSFEGAPLDQSIAYSFWIDVVRPDVHWECASASAQTDFVAPSNLFINTATDTTMYLTWGDVLGESGYELVWSTNNQNFSTLAILGANETEYSLNNLDEYTAYYFKVRALSNNGHSPFSSMSMTYTLMAAPTNVVATPMGDGTIKVSWDDSSAHETDFVVEIAQGAGPWYNPLTVSSGTNFMIISEGPYGALEAGRNYRFSVRSLIMYGSASDRGVSDFVQLAA